MAAKSAVTMVIPGDEPLQIAESPHLDRLRPFGQVIVYRDRPRSLEQQLERVQNAQVILNSRSQVTWPAEAICALPQLRMIATCGIGTDAIDLATARERGIIVANIPGKTAPIVAEHALALLLGVARRVAEQTAELKSGRWIRRENTFLAGKTLGLIGTGSIGTATGKLARAIGMNVIAWTFHPSSERAQALGWPLVELDELLRQSDAVSLHVKLTPQSHHLLGARELALMKPGSLVINTARGAVIETAALVDALKSGHLAGAGLDVFDEEPMPADHPILACENVVLTPHSADQTPEGTDILNAGAVDNIIAFLNGHPQNVVT